jgi:hypothetical protein
MTLKVTAYFALRFFAGTAVPFLNSANKLVILTVNDVHIIIGQLAPFLLDFTLKLIPLSFQNVFVHVYLHTWFVNGVGAKLTCQPKQFLPPTFSDLVNKAASEEVAAFQSENGKSKDILQAQLGVSYGYGHISTIHNWHKVVHAEGFGAALSNLAPGRPRCPR